eukprot:scaffold310993_cov32-Tisochrysis_lutea.AAC.4
MHWLGERLTCALPTGGPAHRVTGLVLAYLRVGRASGGGEHGGPPSSRQHERGGYKERQALCVAGAAKEYTNGDLLLATCSRACRLR